MYRPLLQGLCLATLSVCLMACGSGSATPSTGAPFVQDPNTPPADNGGGNGGQNNNQTTNPVTQDRDGKIYRQAITVAATGDTQVIQVFEPTRLKAGQTYPLVLQGHGYGGSRETTAPAGSFIARLRDAGYYVISIDERGFGESSGQVRVMDPEYEGRDLVAVLDWAEKLEGLRRNAAGRMVVGSYGGSYGGMYQFLLAGADPQHRLRVIAPDITPHDLNYSLNENNVVKSGWGLALVGGGEAGYLTGIQNDPQTVLSTELARLGAGSPNRQDPALYEILMTAGLTNAFDDTGVNFFKYHSVSYFCSGQAAGPQTFKLPITKPDTIPAVVPPTAYPAIDALISQGMMDTLFNFNNGYNNYQCLKAMGGDVRLLSHQSGHILPASVASVPGASAGLDPFYAAINPPEFQGPSGATACGKIKVSEANFAWFEEKLQGKTGAIDKVITTGKDFCMSISDGDAIRLSTMPKGGTAFDINASTPQLNSLLGVVGSLLGGQVREQLQSVQPLMTASSDDQIIAGIPTMSVNVAALDPSLQMADCPVAPLKVGACDPIFYIGIGLQRAGSANWQLVDAQLTPVRGFGAHAVDMNGISARLKKGDRLGLLIYAFHAQYPITWSRDLFVPAARLSGKVQLPILSATDIAGQGI